MTQRAYNVQGAIDLLDQKIKNIKAIGNSKWWSGLDYASYVPPPPLVQYWLEVGSAVFLTKYKTRKIYTKGNTGLQDSKKSCTDFFYQNFHQDGSSEGIARVALKIMENIKKVEKKWEPLIPVWAGCPNPSKVTIEQIQSNPVLCSPPS